MRHICDAHIAAIGLALLGMFGQPAMSQPELKTEDLIRLLGSEQFAERETATRELLRRENCKAALEKALGAKDPEIRARARQILAEHQRRRNEGLVRAVCDAASRREPDTIVDLLTATFENREEDARCWDAVARVAAEILESEKRVYRTVRFPGVIGGAPKLAAHVVLNSGQCLAIPRITRERLGTHLDGPVLLRAKEIDCDSLNGVTAVCADRICARTLGSSIVLANGDVLITGALVNSVVIADGDFAASRVCNSLVIARGGAQIESVSDSRVLCGKRVGISGSVRTSCIVSDREIEFKGARHISGSTFKEKAAGALSFVRYFDVMAAGIAIEETRQGVYLRKVQCKGPLAHAGIREDDMLLTIGGTAADSAERVRRELRRRLASREDFIIRMQRNDQVVEVSVSAKQ